MSTQRSNGERVSADNLRENIIPIGKASPVVEEARAQMATSLAEVSPRRRTPPQSLVTKEGRFVLHGDLFKTGGCFALIEVPLKSEDNPQYNNGAVALAEWASSRWRLRGLWNIPAVWRPKGWKDGDNNDYLPATPATHPFEVRDFDGDGIPEVTIAGEVERYFQGYYLLRFQPKTHGLVLLAYAMAKPERLGSYTRLYSNSGRRAIYEEWEYFRWSGARMFSTAVWHDETPYNGDDPRFVIAEAHRGKGNTDRYRITDAVSDSDRETAYTITRNGKSYARLRVTWKSRNPPGDVATGDQAVRAWLFEKFTGISREYYPRGQNDPPPAPERLARVEKYATVHVAGSKEAVRRLSAR